MGNVFSANLGGMAAHAASHHAAGAGYSAAASVDSTGAVAAVAAALGPIGAHYVAAYATAQANNIAAAKQLAHVHTAHGDATLSSVTAINATDNA